MLKAKKRSSRGQKETLSTGKKRKSVQDNENVDKDFMNEVRESVFGKLVTKAGISITAGKTQNSIELDQNIFQRNLSSALKRHQNYPQVVDEFVEGLVFYVEEPKRFCLSLLPTLTSENCEESAHGPTQDSLMRMLLGIDSLQPSIVNVLLEKIPEFSEDNGRVSQHDVPRLVMNQFKWLDRIMKPKELSEKILEIISISSVSIQREVITCIPEILDDNEHVEIAKELIDLMIQNSQLTVPILDTLTNLNLRSDLVAEVRASVIDMLSSTAMDDLPVVVKFVLQSVSDSEAFEAITELRNNLEFSCSLVPTATSTPANSRRSGVPSKSQDGVLLTLDAIKSSIRFKKSIADGWIKTVDNVKNATEHMVIDLFVILILYAVTSKRKIVESLLRSKVRSGCFSEDVLNMAFVSYGQVFREYFESLLVLSEILLRSPDPIVSSYAQKIYTHAFLTFDLYCKQEVIGALVTHVGSGFVNEADSSLDVLKNLVENHPSEMSQFAVFLKGILDYLDNLSISQIRKLFAMLSTLAFCNNDGSMIQDDMHMVIRKQLSSNSVKYKRIGIIGAIMIVRSIACRSAKEESATESTGSQLAISTNDKQKRVTGLLDMVRNSIGHVPEAAALFYDELANVIEKKELDPKIESWISEAVVSDFQDDFLIDIETGLPSSGMPVDFMWPLDDAEEGCIALNLVPLMLKSSVKVSREASSSRNVAPICMAPHFRLVRISEQSQNDGNLEGIDALLGCPIVMFNIEEIIESFEKLSVPDRELICNSLFYCLNWLRELINAFSTEGDPEMKGKTISRIQRITTLQEWLENCLRETPSFTPPLVHFDAEDNAKKVTPPKPSVKRTQRGKMKNKTQDVDKTIDEETVKDSYLKDETSVEEKKKDKNVAILSSSNYRACFRELDLNVFDVLKCGLVSKAVLDSNMNTETKVILQLQAPELNFLLDDLSTKLQYSLSSSGKKTFAKLHQGRQIGFSHLARQSALNVVIYVLGLFPNICEHLEATSAFFQELTEENDGVIDGPGRNTVEAKMMACCFERIFTCLVQFFSWSGFSVTRNKPHLKAAFVVLGSRIKISKKSQPGFQELACQALRYFEQFSDNLPSIGAAVALAKLLTALKNRSEKQETALSLSRICGDFLKREWIQADGTREQGAKYNEHLQYLLKQHILYAKDPSAAIEAITTGAVTELLEENELRLMASTTLPTLTKSTFPTYYKTLLDCLVIFFKDSQSTPMKRIDSIEIKRERLVQINVAVRLFHILVNLVKAFEHRSVLSAALKYGRMFVETFVSLGMPVLDEMLRTNKDDVNGLLKSFQQSTRRLQHFCGHSKVVKDISLTNQVPALKKCLETFVFRVKAMLAVNQCQEAFWIGNLKNRDLRGQEIMSQRSTREEDEEEEEEEEEDEEEEQKSNEDQESVMSCETGGGEDEEDEQSCSESF